MRLERNEHAKAAPSRIALNFWALVTIVLVLAVTSSGFAVRWTALPFLDKYQREQLAVHTREAAQKFDAILSRQRAFLTFIADDATVESSVMGYVDNPDYFPDLLQGLRRPKELVEAALFDAFGEELGAFSTDQDQGNQQPMDWPSALVETTLDAEISDRTVTVELFGSELHVVMALPVVHNGLVEGVVIGRHVLDAANVFPVHGYVENTHLVPIAQDASDHPTKQSDTGVEALLEANYFVVQNANLNELSAAGRVLIRDTIVALGSVLFGAFGVFAFIGHSVVIEPHRKIEKQKDALEEKERRLEAQKHDLLELAAIAERANDSIVVTDLEGRITWANPSFFDLSGYSLEDCLNHKPGSLLQGPDTDLQTVRAIREALEDFRPIKTEILNYGASKAPYWVSLNISPLEGDDGRPYAFLAISYDITEKRLQREEIERAQKEIEYQALHDALTGLPNRRALDDALADRTKNNKPTTLVRIDLDHFKNVNDTMGHEAGDFALSEVAKILKKETKERDMPARVGGDEFVLLLAEGTTPDAAETVANRILKQVRVPKKFDGSTIRFGASFGIASSHDGMLGVSDLVIGADAALYLAKDQGRNQVCRYTRELHQTVGTNRTLARELKAAVAEEEFEPFFQPQFDAVTHDIVGVEALARWPSKNLGLVLPDSFLPVAQQLSLIRAIDDIIYRKALRQIGQLQDEGLNISRLALNVTADRIRDPDVLAAVRQDKRDDLQITFEVLESVLVEEQNDQFKFSLDSLREAGVAIEIDDFGSGHASIVGLMKLQPDAMKIDRRLVDNIVHDPISYGVIGSIVDIANLMGLRIIAEGVETAEHAECLKRLGCHTLQGFGFCKPMDLRALRTFVKSHDAGSFMASSGG